MKHGPIALIDEMMPVVFIAPHDAVFEKIVSNIQEVKARKGKIIAITSRDEEALEGLVDYEFRVPETIDLLTPMLASVPLQLLAVLHRGEARVQRGPAAQPGQVGHGGVARTTGGVARPRHRSRPARQRVRTAGSSRALRRSALTGR